MKKLLLLPLLCGIASAHPHHHHHRHGHLPPVVPVMCPVPAPVAVRPVVPVVVRPVVIFGQQQQQVVQPPPPAYQEPQPLPQAPLPELPPAPVEKSEK